MIRVEPQPEPPDFDAKVRQPGLSALAELVGQPKTIERRGPSRKKLAERVEDLAPDALPPFWRHCLPQLAEAYRRICAYSCHYVERTTGHGTVDHFVPKSRDARMAYDWANYRFACGRMNARKGVAATVLDPFEVQDGWFQVELVRFQLRAAPGLPVELVARIDETIAILSLNDETFLEDRAEACKGFGRGSTPWPTSSAGFPCSPGSFVGKDAFARPLGPPSTKRRKAPVPLNGHRIPSGAPSRPCTPYWTSSPPLG